MPFLRINNLSQLPTEYGLKEVQPCPTFKEARKIGREAYRVIYYFKRSGGFPPLLFEKKARILDHEYIDGACVHCGQAEPKPEDQPTAAGILPEPEQPPAPPIDPELLKVTGGNLLISPPEDEQQGNEDVTLPKPLKGEQLSFF